MESVATMRTIIDAAEGWMERNPVMMEKRIMRNIERVRAECWVLGKSDG